MSNRNKSSFGSYQNSIWSVWIKFCPVLEVCFSNWYVSTNILLCLGVNKLYLDTVDPAIIPCVQQLSEHLDELSCYISALILPNFPQLNLEKLFLLYNFDISESKLLRSYSIKQM